VADPRVVVERRGVVVLVVVSVERVVVVGERRMVVAVVGVDVGGGAVVGGGCRFATSSCFLVGPSSPLAAARSLATRPGRPLPTLATDARPSARVPFSPLWMGS
jgi:hypothetical protein